jgi:hypothetical protein
LNSIQGGLVHFNIVRAAGTISCTEYFKRGQGSGTFSFQPNPEFPREMSTLGYNDLDEEMIFRMALGDVNPQFVRDIRAVDSGRISAYQLVELRQNHVTVEYIRELSSRGYGTLSPEKLAELRRNRVTQRLSGITVCWDTNRSPRRLWKCAPTG